jgi:hypothetical protein
LYYYFFFFNVFIAFDFFVFLPIILSGVLFGYVTYDAYSNPVKSAPDDILPKVSFKVCRKITSEMDDIEKAKLWTKVLNWESKKALKKKNLELENEAMEAQKRKEQFLDNLNEKETNIIDNYDNVNDIIYQKILNQIKFIEELYQIEKSKNLNNPERIRFLDEQRAAAVDFLRNTEFKKAQELEIF